MPAWFEMLIDPFEQPGTVERSEAEIARIEIPTYTGSGWYGYTYKTHLQGAQTYWRHLRSPKKLLFPGPAHLERPFHGLHDEILRWYDHWLKGIDTGVLDEPPVRYWVSGANEWRTAEDWPPPETQWTKLYLTSWERLRAEPFTPARSTTASRPTRSCRCRCRRRARSPACATSASRSRTTCSSRGRRCCACAPRSTRRTRTGS